MPKTLLALDIIMLCTKNSAGFRYYYKEKMLYTEYVYSQLSGITHSAFSAMVRASIAVSWLFDAFFIIS